jgi:hypothetical protein
MSTYSKANNQIHGKRKVMSNSKRVSDHPKKETSKSLFRFPRRSDATNGYNCYTTGVVEGVIEIEGSSVVLGMIVGLAVLSVRDGVSSGVPWEGTRERVGGEDRKGGDDGVMVRVGNSDSVGETDGYSVAVAVGEIDNVGSAEGDIDMVGDIETVGMPDGAEETVGEIESVGRAVGILDGLAGMDGEVVGCGSVGTGKGDVLGDSDGGKDDILFRIKILLSSTALLSSVSS